METASLTILNTMVRDGQIHTYLLLLLIFSLSWTGTLCLDLLPPEYDPHLQPRGPDGGPVTVALSMRINSINEVDERDMKVKMEVYMRAGWRDPRLVVPPHIHNNTKAEEDGVVLSGDVITDLDLWLPDPYVERAEEIHSASLIQPFWGVRLHKDSRIQWSQMFIITLRCAMFFNDFPFDKQTCYLQISSFFYNSRDLAFDWDGEGIMTSPEIPHMLSNFHFEFHRENVTACTTDGFVNGEYPCLKASMTLTRRYRNYLMAVYFPSFIFVVVSWVSFFWPADAIPARTVLLITAMLTTISLYSSVQQITPPANYTRAIDNWFFACIVAVASALFQYAFILQIRKKQETTSKKSWPRNIAVVSAEATDVGSNMGHPGLNDDGSSSHKNRDIAYWRNAEMQVEKGAKILYMIFFIIFNLAYWITYL